MENTAVKRGNDPRAFAETDLLRDEIAKLTHPARPDVSWQRIEENCQALFHKNGVDLRTAAFYTAARGHLAGLAGVNEGLGIISALASHHWESLWPQQESARTDVLNWLSVRVLQRLRALKLQKTDLPLLHLTEQNIAQLCATLQRYNVKSLSKFEQIQSWLQQAINMFKRGSEPHDAHVSADAPSVDVPLSEHVETGLTLPPSVESTMAGQKPDRESALIQTTAERQKKVADKPQVTAKHTPESAPQTSAKARERNSVPAVAVAFDEVVQTSTPVAPALQRREPAHSGISVTHAISPPEIPVVPASRRTPGFITGFISALLLAIIIGGIAWWFIHPTNAPLFASVAPLPQVLDAAEVARLQQMLTPGELASSKVAWFTALDEKLTALALLPPLWRQTQEDALLNEAQTLWPQDDTVKAKVMRERDRRVSQALPVDALQDWHRAQQRLVNLTDRLNALDERRGRWLTGSELKTAIFDIRQSMEKTPPLEELLRQFAQLQANGENPVVLRKQIDDRFEQLLSRYALIDPRARDAESVRMTH